MPADGDKTVTFLFDGKEYITNKEMQRDAALFRRLFGTMPSSTTMEDDYDKTVRLVVEAKEKHDAAEFRSLFRTMPSSSSGDVNRANEDGPPRKKENVSD